MAWHYVDEDGESATLIEHWDGTTWSAVTSVNPGQHSNRLNAVTAIGPKNVWAVGSTDAGLVEHWNGEGWTVVPSSDPGNCTNAITTISADSATDAWAVGTYADGDEPDLERSLILPWDGTSWTISKDPSVAP